MQRDRNELKQKVIELFNEGKYQKVIEKELNICSHTIKKFLKEENLISRHYRKNFFNEHYFEKIDSEDKAYFLGLLYADGNIYLKRKRTQITLQNEDRYILEKFKEYLNCSTKLYLDRNKYSKLILDSDKLSSDLIKLGCVPNKSLILEFPTEEQVPKEFISHFIRGYFDGDGHISKSKRMKNYFNINITSTENFLIKINNILIQNNIICGKLNKRYKNKEVSAFTMFIKNISTSDFFNFLYKDASIFLNRKYNEFNK